jgi:hypothetical protein
MPVAGCGGVRPVVDVANRIGHTRRPVSRMVSSSGTRPESCAGRRPPSSMWLDKRAVRVPSCRSVRSGCPLFDRPKRGRKKPHQPALAHCVRVAGLDALRLTALLCAGATNRLPDSRHAPLRRRAVRDATPRKARKSKTEEGEAGGAPLFLFYSEESQSGEDLNPRLRLTYDP